MKPRLLDLFCGAGGAAMGYARAGFDICGVDVNEQPRYPFEFLRFDITDWQRTRELIEDDDFAAIHASPPCQRWTIGQNARKNADAHPDLITPLRPLLEAAGLPYVIENVPRAPLRRDVVLCGTQFGLVHDGFELRRHRIFELNWPIGCLVPPCAHQLPAAPVFGHNAGRDFMRRHGRGFNAVAMRAIMGTHWMTRDETSEAIPPDFAELIGRQLLQHVLSGEGGPEGGCRAPGDKGALSTERALEAS